MNAVDSEAVSILLLGIRASINTQYQRIIERYKNVVRSNELLTELTKMKAPVYKSQEVKF